MPHNWKIWVSISFQDLLNEIWFTYEYFLFFIILLLTTNILFLFSLNYFKCRFLLYFKKKTGVYIINMKKKNCTWKNCLLCLLVSYCICMNICFMVRSEMKIPCSFLYIWNKNNFNIFLEGKKIITRSHFLRCTTDLVW